ncbi:MAG: oxidoreductase [Nocardioidaceae bacterium]|nr:oxidoreductase [Nocardioidaceae bacterium]
MADVLDPFGAAAELEGVPSALAAARSGIDVLLRDRGLRRTTPALTAESLLRGAAASAALEGSGTNLDDLRSGRGDAIATAAARLNSGLLALVPVIASAPLQALARMHALAAADTEVSENLGRPRLEAGFAARLQLLSRQLVAPTRAPALSVASLAHAELATLRPFGSRDGLVARAIERLILVSRGVDPASLIVPEAGHAAMGTAYHQALNAYGERSAQGRRRWLLYAAQALGRASELSPLP